MPPLPQFIDVQRPTKRRRLQMPTAADGFNHRHRPPPVPRQPRQPKTPLKHVVPPTFSLPISKALHPPRPPPPPVHITPDRELKTISTTSIALLNSSNGGEDLAAFLLPHRTTVTPISRGIDLSPEKKAKFVRGGLAARASSLFKRAHTSLVLWKKETERRATLPHLTATVVKILHLPNKPSVVIALCRIHHTDHPYAPNQLYKIVFSVPHLSPDRFKEGLTVRIFHPWHELSSTPSSHRAPPASLPLPLSLPSTPDLPINSATTLFCSRFII